MVNLRRSNSHWAFHASNLIGINETRMRHRAHIDALAFRKEASHVLGAEAVAHSTDLSNAEILAHVLDNGFDDRIYLSRPMAFAFWASSETPSHDVKVFRHVERDGVAFVEIGHYDEISICGELIGNTAVEFFGKLLSVVGSS